MLEHTIHYKKCCFVSAAYFVISSILRGCEQTEKPTAETMGHQL